MSVTNLFAGHNAPGFKMPPGNGEVTWQKVTYVTATSTTISPAFDTEGNPICSVIFPAALVGTSFALHVCDTLGGTYLPLQDYEGNAIAFTTVTLTASAHFMHPAVTRGYRFFKFVAASAQDANIVIRVGSCPVS